MTRFVYLVEDHPEIGEVGDYAKALRDASIGDIYVDHSAVWTFKDGLPVATKPTIRSSPFDGNYFSTLTVEVVFDGAPEIASVQIDGTV